MGYLSSHFGVVIRVLGGLSTEENINWGNLPHKFPLPLANYYLDYFNLFAIPFIETALTLMGNQLHEIIDFFTKISQLIYSHVPELLIV